MKKILWLASFLAVFVPAAFASGAALENQAPASAGISSTAKVEVFVTSWCPYCKKLESFLKKNHIQFTRYDIENDAKGAELFDRIGGTGVPVTRVGKEVIHGYDPERLVAALQAEA